MSEVNLGTQIGISVDAAPFRTRLGPRWPDHWVTLTNSLTVVLVSSQHDKILTKDCQAISSIYNATSMLSWDVSKDRQCCYKHTDFSNEFNVQWLRSIQLLAIVNTSTFNISCTVADNTLQETRKIRFFFFFFNILYHLRSHSPRIRIVWNF